MNFWMHLVLPLLTLLAIGVVWTIFMNWLGNLFGNRTGWHPLTVATTANAISTVISRLVMIAFYWTIAYLIFDVLL